jgi:hypothetical protein
MHVVDDDTQPVQPPVAMSIAMMIVAGPNECISRGRQRILGCSRLPSEAVLQLQSTARTMERTRLAELEEYPKLRARTVSLISTGPNPTTRSKP